MQELSSKYEILRVMGHGGFSAVFKARSRENPERIVALKQLDFSIDNKDSKEYRDFKDEVEILKKLSHPNIVKIYDEFILDNKPSLEMEFLDGETLESILKREKFFSIAETIDFIAQISSALSYCHHYQLPDSSTTFEDSAFFKRNSIIHNDLNPKNIIRVQKEDGSFRYVLIDFGLSFTDPDAVRHSKKEDGMAEYKSPEKWTGAEVDTQSDIYSLGVVIYEMLTGSAPFPISDYKDNIKMLELGEKHKKATVPDIDIRRGETIEKNNLLIVPGNEIPNWLNKLILKCLQKRPMDRFLTGRELSNFFYDGLAGKIEEDVQTAIIDIHPIEDNEKRGEARLEIVPNILTEAQHFFINKDFTTIGRRSDGAGTFITDIAIKTADKFISKNHCQIIRIANPGGGFIYKLQDSTPSKNGTFFNIEKNTQRLSEATKILLKDGDFFWIGNTKIIFHED